MPTHNSICQVTYGDIRTLSSHGGGDGDNVVAPILASFRYCGMRVASATGGSMLMFGPSTFGSCPAPCDSSTR